MLEHLHDPPKAPARAVVLGSRGFVGGAVTRDLRSLGVDVLALGRADIDLLGLDAGETLATKLHPDDCLVFVSALAPCRDLDLLMRNLAMVRAVCAALEKRPVAHVVNISSDAVYAPSVETVDERTPTAPTDLHGMMHAARELMLQTAVKAPLCILRPTLLYGAADPHNGYGPNRFRRLAADGKEISLFGNGEEQRDHVLIDDVAAIVGACILHRAKGVLNVATGRSLSFRQVAEMVVAGQHSASKIVPSPRRNPILHRHFDVVDRVKAFPRFAFTPLEQGLARVQAELGARRG